MTARIDWGYDAQRLGVIGFSLIENGSPMGTISLTGQYLHEHSLAAVRSMDPVTCEYDAHDLGYRVLADALADALNALGAGTYTVYFDPLTAYYTIGATGLTSFSIASQTSGALRMLGELESTGALEWSSSVPAWHHSTSAVGAWSEWSHRDADADADTLTAADGSVRGLSPVGVASLLDFVASWEPREAVRSDESGYSPRDWTWQRAIARCRAIEPAVIVTADDAQKHVAYLRPDHVLRPRLAARDYLAHQSVPLAWHVVGELVADLTPISGALVATLATPSISATGEVLALIDKVGATAWGAWGTRRLRRAYTGQCMRVRRASDGVESDFGFATSGWLDSAALSSWLGSSDGFVKTLYDQSGSGLDMSAPNNATQPRIALAGTVDTKNGFPAMYSSGSARLSTSMSTHGSSSFLSTAVASFDSITGNPRIVSIKGTGQNDDFTANTSCAAIYSPGATNVTSYRATTAGNNVSYGSNGTLFSSWSRYAASNVRAVAVAGAESTDTYTTTALGSSVELSIFAANWASGGDADAPMTGHIGEVVHWAVALNSTQRSALYADQSAAWGV